MRHRRYAVSVLLFLLPCSAFAAGDDVVLTVGIFAGRSITTCMVSSLEPLHVEPDQPTGGPLPLVTIRLEADGDEVRARAGTAPVATISSTAPLQVNVGKGAVRTYRGSLLVKAKGGRLLLFNRVGLEDYLRGSVPAEVPPSFAPEALKAQAIAARTYALVTRGKHRASGYDLCDGVHCQMYLGVQEEDPRVDQAIAETAGLIVTYHGKPIEAVYHDNCGGETASSSDVWGTDPEPYLCSVEDKGEDGLICALAPRSSWIRQLPLASVIRALADYGVRPPITAIVPQACADGERAKGYKFVGAGEGTEWTIRAAQVRTAVNGAVGPEALPSADFSAMIDGDSLIVTGRGFGHGVGMCQWGAHGLARAGYTAEQILAHYYPGTTVERRAWSVERDGKGNGRDSGSGRPARAARDGEVREPRVTAVSGGGSGTQPQAGVPTADSAR